jgi:hypothetical protein
MYSRKERNRDGELLCFYQEHKCLKWEDYEFTRHELEEPDRLCYGNWIVIQRLYAYIDELRTFLENNHIDYPEI